MSLLLVSVTVYSSDGPKLLKQAVGDLAQKMEILKISSVYRVFGEVEKPSHIHDIRSLTAYDGLCVVVQLKSQLKPTEVLDFLKEVELVRKSEILHRNLSLNLLMYDEISQMTPQLTLPHPDLHRRPELTIPSAEIWGEAKHPILGVKLNQLSKAFREQNWGEFFAQGQSLLDF